MDSSTYKGVRLRGEIVKATLITTSNSSRRTSESAMVKVKSHGISILFDLMQRLLSSFIRSRSLIYPPPRSFLISARVKSSSPGIVLSKELSNKAIDTAERASATTLESADEIWTERSNRLMDEISRSPPRNPYSG